MVRGKLFIQVNRGSRKLGFRVGIVPWYILKHYHMPQDYPRTEEGLLDEGRLAPHTRKIPFDELKTIIRDAIASAARKSRREILELPDELSDEQKATLYHKKG